ncbi:uncharacterized protein LOC123979492 [Micropterus dolomieu]|uniref:uncharacterized protein LOC123979492 n=1 Tax=Micropterus dolomieu TaxID=147949 RepID=UPI001E8D2872|nr:uncharacterized protein LOC123979492 [Micropterus dolomieu]
MECKGEEFMLSTNFLLSGNNYRKVAFLFNFMQLGMVAESTFFKIQDTYCIEPIDEFWQKIRADVLTRLRAKDKVVVLGDGRMDSPGHAVINHVRNQHTWATVSCEHEPLGDGTQDKTWIEQGSAAHQALVAIVQEKRWLKNVKKFINFRTTSDMENFQNHILMYAGKRYSYNAAVYCTRTVLAAIDYNCHNRRLPSRNRDEIRFTDDTTTSVQNSGVSTH